MEKKLYIFDLDGTLADSYTAIEKSLNFTLQRLGYPPVSYAEVKRKIGRGDKLFIQTFFLKKDVEQALKIYRRHHQQSLRRYSRLKQDARYLLSGLKQRKKILAIASNRPKYFTGIILKKLGIRKYFDYVVCADTVKNLKPNPKILNIILKKSKIVKEKAIFIGDMAIDLETAQRAGIEAIFVKGGSGTFKEVKGYKIKKSISSLRQILNL